jgi:transcriptional regulator with XRE-family HTH domain
MPAIQPQVESSVNRRLVVIPSGGEQNQPMVKDNIVWLEIEGALRRKEKTQEWLAEQLGLSNNAVTKWKQSGQIALENAKRVSVVLDIPLDRLLLGKGNPLMEVLEALPLERSKAVIAQIMYQVEHAEDVLKGDQIVHYLKAISGLIKDMEKRRAAREEPAKPTKRGK